MHTQITSLWILRVVCALQRTLCRHWFSHSVDENSSLNGLLTGKIRGYRRFRNVTLTVKQSSSWLANPEDGSATIFRNSGTYLPATRRKFPGFSSTSLWELQMWQEVPSVWRHKAKVWLYWRKFGSLC